MYVNYMDGKTYFYLTYDEVRHYHYMLSHGYAHKIVGTDTQRYVVFALIDKPHVGIAWPTISGNIDYMPSSFDVILEPFAELQEAIASQLVGSTIRGLLFPRYSE